MAKTCWLCASTEWHDVDFLRADPQGMIVCKGCGLVTFKRFDDPAEYKAYYDTEYRESKQANASNLITTNRKIGYHDKFLGPWLRERQEKKLPPPRVGEIGAGIGYFLRWMRDIWKCEDVRGAELTTAYRRYAQHAFNITTVTEDFDYSHTYDLLCVYHTVEHFPDPKEVLVKLRGCLAPGGILYLATPIWMEELMKWGGGPFTTFDDHFHPDHINAWSRWHFKSLLDITGWKIVKDDPQFYGWTMFCETTEPISLGTPPKSAQDVITQLSDMQRAATSYRKGNFQEAIRLYPQFVDAYMAEIGNAVKDVNKQMELCELGSKLCPNTRLFHAQKGLILYQYDRWDDAERELSYAIEVKPHDDNLLMHVGMIYLKRGDLCLKQGKVDEGKKFFRTAVNIFDKIIGINPTVYTQCFDYIAYIFSMVPKEEELATDGKKYSAPHAEGAPHIDLLREQVK